MATKAYTLKKKKETGELHIFEAVPTTGGKCIPETKSICGKMKESESVENKFACKTEPIARTECARIGRKVCGTCVSSLYTTY